MAALGVAIQFGPDVPAKFATNLPSSTRRPDLKLERPPRPVTELEKRATTILEKRLPGLGRGAFAHLLARLAGLDFAGDHNNDSRYAPPDGRKPLRRVRAHGRKIHAKWTKDLERYRRLVSEAGPYADDQDRDLVAMAGEVIEAFGRRDKLKTGKPACQFRVDGARACLSLLEGGFSWREIAKLIVEANVAPNFVDYYQRIAKKHGIDHLEAIVNALKTPAEDARKSPIE